MSEYFDIKQFEFVKLINQMSMYDRFLISDLLINDENDLKVKIKSDSHFLSFNQLSHSEQDKTIFEISLNLAKYYANFYSTVLIIDFDMISSIDTSGINEFFKIINEKNFTFQIIVNLVENRPEPYSLNGFNSIRLKLIDGKTVMDV